MRPQPPDSPIAAINPEINYGKKKVATSGFNPSSRHCLL